MKKTSIKNPKITIHTSSSYTKKVGIGFKKTLGFTIIEIVTTIVILAVLSIIAFTYVNNYKLTQYNTVRASDIDLLNNTMQSYYETNKKYPLPAWNRQYFDEYWVYSHSSTWAYWVSWFITSQTFGKEFMIVTQKDPTTKYYYAYARTLDNKPTFQFATSLDEKGTYYGYVKWSYAGNELAWIVREYNWPNFVINNNPKYLPYNPTALKITWNIASYSWWVQIYKNGVLSNISTELEEWYQVKTDTWALATINLSDGSELRLWSNLRSSVLDFSTLKYKEDDNLLTEISLKLTMWEIWVKAPQLEKWSDFMVETDNAAASVRWTVFWMSTDGNGNWSIDLIEWKIQIYSKNGSWDFTPYFPSVYSTTWSIRLENNEEWTQAVMEVLPWESWVSLDYQSTTWGTYINSTSTWTVSQTTEDTIMQPQIRMKSSYIPKILSMNKWTWTLDIKFSNNGWNNYRYVLYDDSQADSINQDKTILDNKPWIVTGSIDNTSDFVYITWINVGNNTHIAFQICDTSSNIIASSSATTDWVHIMDANANKCSSWNTIWFDPTKPVSIKEDSLQKVEIQKQQAEWCPAWQEWSTISNQCELPWLVAYAWYDAPGDIFMSILNDKVLFTNTNNIVTTSEFSPYFVVKNKQEVWNSLKWSVWYWTLLRTPNYSLTTQTFDTSTNGTIPNNTWWFISYNRSFSYFELPRTNSLFPNWWIYIDAKWTSPQDYLKYDLSPLQLWNNFTIEMSVRGAALKRISWKYKLFNFILNSNSTDINLNIYNWNLSLYWIDSLWTSRYAMISKNLLSTLSDNVFYEVSSKFVDNKISLEIIWTNIKSEASINWTLNKWGQILIWSDYALANQWNDIINYVKIYKN